MADNVEIRKYNMSDLNTGNYVSPKHEFICQKREFQRFPELFPLLEQMTEPVPSGGVTPTYFIPTPKVPFAMQSPMRIYNYESIDANTAKIEIGFGFKLRNPTVRLDYRSEDMPSWWTRAIEYTEAEAMPEIKKAILLYADVLVFYDQLFIGKAIESEHFPDQTALVRRELFSLALSCALKKHHCFESSAPVFSMQAKKACVQDEGGHKIQSCLNCKTDNADKPLLTCGKCKTAKYCGKECQKAHWPEHKHFCKAVREEAEALLGPTPKHIQISPVDFVTEARVEGPRGELIWGQLYDLFSHTCYQCYGWLQTPRDWDEEPGFCSRACARRYNAIWE